MSNSLALLIPIAAITAGPASWAFSNYLRAKHGYEPLPREKGRRGNRRDETRDTLDDARKIMLLTNENEKLTGKIGRLEERLAVLERIATDPAERTAREIDALRDR